MAYTTQGKYVKIIKKERYKPAQKKYDYEYKVQAVKLAQKIGSARAAKELGISENTGYGWMRAVREGRPDVGTGAHTPQNALTLNEELLQLRKRVKDLEKENRRIKEENEFLEEASAFFAASRRKKLRLKFIASKTSGGAVKGKISLYCRVLDAGREGFRKYLINCDKPRKYESIAEEMRQILAEDECNDTYGRVWMYRALKLRNSQLHIPSERTVYRIMREIGINHTLRRKPNGITKAGRNARHSEAPGQT